MSAGRLEISGVPSPQHTAALAAAVEALIASERRPADPIPAVYRSRWRRAARAGALRAMEVAR